MRPLMTPILTLRHLPIAALRAGVLAAHLAIGLSGTAFAQSATPPDQTSTPTDQTGVDPAGATDDAASGDDTDADGALDSSMQSAADPEDEAIGGTVSQPSDILDAGNLQEMRRQNMREATVDGLRTRSADDRNEAPGVRVGSFILRPSLTETLGSERTTTGKDTTSRSYLSSSLRASMISDWSLHQLKIDATGTWQKTLSGVRQDDPEGSINSELRLDLSDQTTATLRAGYSLSREEIGDPNAIANAVTQAEVNEYTASAEITRDLGVLRATAGIDFTRETYGNALLANNVIVDQSARDNNEAIARARLGYELSPALIPFLEASYGQIIYDQHVDGGNVRDADLYAAKAGLEVDLGEKLKGELAGGYTVAEFDDAALKSISAATIDGNAVWSPRRGTDLALNLKTEIEPSTVAGDSGSTAYNGTVVLSQVILENLTGQISSGLTLRDYSNDTVPVQTVLSLGTGLTWSISRSLDFNADVAWEKTQQQNIETTDVLRAGVGLTLKR